MRETPAAPVQLTPEDYSERVERLYDRTLRARMEAALNVARDEFVADGYTVRGPYDLSDDTFRWAITVEDNGLREAIDVSIEIAESLAYEGETDGVNVGLSLVEYGGHIIGELNPDDDVAARIVRALTAMEEER